MLNISATKLRGNLFEILKRVEAGEKVIICHKKKEVACIVPIAKKNWRERIDDKPRLLVSPDELIKPIEDVWEDYID